MNKSECTQLIDKLADKTLSFGCRVYCEQAVEHDYGYEDVEGTLMGMPTASGECTVLIDYNDEQMLIPYENPEILGHPVLIGDVLKRMTGLLIDKPSKGNEIFGLWCDCGFSKSLQTIMDESGFEGARFKTPGEGLEPDGIGESVWLKDPYALALFSSFCLNSDSFMAAFFSAILSVCNDRVALIASSSVL